MIKKEKKQQDSMPQPGLQPSSSGKPGFAPRSVFSVILVGSVNYYFSNGRPIFQ